MRDYYSSFGLATCVATTVAVACPNGLDLAIGGGLGYRPNLSVVGKFVTHPLKGTDTVTIEIFESADKTTWVKSLGWTSTKAAASAIVYEAGDKVRVPLPKEHLQYIEVKVTVTGVGVGATTASVPVECYLEEG